MNNDRFLELDRRVTEEIKSEMKAEGVETYPVKCNCNNCPDCPDCGGQGQYEMEVETL